MKQPNYARPFAVLLICTLTTFASAILAGIANLDVAHTLADISVWLILICVVVQVWIDTQEARPDRLRRR